MGSGWLSWIYYDILFPDKFPQKTANFWSENMEHIYEPWPQVGPSIPVFATPRLFPRGVAGAVPQGGSVEGYKFDGNI